MTHPYNPDDPAFREAVLAVVAPHVKDIVATITIQLDRAGYTESAQFVRANFGG